MKMPTLSDPQWLWNVSNLVYLAAVFLTVIATVCIFVFGNRVTSLKDLQLKTYQKEADARIAEAHVAVEQAKVEVARANQIAAQAREKAEKIEQQNLVLQAELTKEQEARLAIEKRIAQRGLNLIDINALRQAIFPLGVQSIDIVYYKDDAEVRTLAANLYVAFAAWKVTLYEAPGGNSHQVDIDYDPNDKKAEERAHAIFYALNNTNKLRIGGPFPTLPYPIPGTGVGYYSIPPSATIRIFVGYR